MGDSIFATQKFQMQSGQIKNTIHVTCSFFFSCVFLCVFFLLGGSLFFHPLPFSSSGLLEMTELIPTRVKHSCMIKKNNYLPFLSSHLVTFFLSRFRFVEPSFPRVKSHPDCKLGTMGDTFTLSCC